MERKCPCCGSKKLQNFNAMTIIDGDYYVHSYACADCGYVLFFANDLDKVKSSFNKATEENKQKNAIALEMAKLNSEIKDCNMIIEKLKTEIEVLKQKADDDSITVREQKELLKMAEAKKAEISAVLNKIKKLSNATQIKRQEYDRVGYNPYNDHIN